MPNIRRTFPGSSAPPPSRSAATDEENDGSDSDDGEGGEERANFPPPRGKMLRVGGGKAIHPQDDDEEEISDDSSADSQSDDDGDEAPVSTRSQGGGKMLRPRVAVGGGKYLRPTTHGEEEEDDEDDDEVDDEELPENPPGKHEQQVVRPQVYRGGGKNLIRMRPPEEEEEDSEDDDEDDGDDDNDSNPDDPVSANTATVTTAGAAAQAIRVMPRSGGKSLMRMQSPSQLDSDDDESLEDDEDDEEEDDDEDADKDEPKRIAYGKGSSIPSTLHQSPLGGKMLRRPNMEFREPPLPPEAPAVVATSTKPSLPVPTTHDPISIVLPQTPLASANATSVAEIVSGGEQEARPTESKEKGPVETSQGKKLDTTTGSTTTTAPASSAVILRSPTGGKILRSPNVEPNQENDDSNEVIHASASKATAKVVPSPTTRSARTGKVLRLPPSTKKEEKEAEPSTSSEELDVDDDDDDDDDDFEESVAVKAKAKSPARKRRAAVVSKLKQISEDSDDGAFDASDDEEELDMNNTEALIKNDADREYLDSLPELEREAILGERFEKLKAEHDMKKAIREAKLKETAKAKETSTATRKRAAAARRKAPAPSKRSKTSATDGDEELARKLSSRRESARDRDANKAKSKKAIALAALKKEKKIQQQQKADDSSEESLDFGDDDDDDSDDDYEETGGLKPWQQNQRERAAVTDLASRLVKREDSDGEDDEIEDDDEETDDKFPVPGAADGSTGPADLMAGLEDFLKVTIPRRRLCRWCNEPFFTASVLECFVRLFIGEDDSGEKVYRLCEIVDVKEGAKSYKFPTASKADTPTTSKKLLRLKFGKSEKDFPMILISDSPPTEKDVQKYLTNQKNNRLEVLTKRKANKLRRLQDNLVNNYTYTNEDIERNLQARKKEGKGVANLGLEQTKIAIAVQGAKESVSDAELRVVVAKKKLFESSDSATHLLEENVKDAEKALEYAKTHLLEVENEEMILSSKVDDRNRRLAKRKGDVDWAKVNERAIQMNQRVDREALKIKAGPSIAGAVKKDGEFNPYARRRVKPKILWEVGQGKDNETQLNDNNLTVVEETQVTVVDVLTKDENADVPNLVHDSNENKTPMSTDSHQFAIDEEGLAISGLGSTKKDSSVKQRLRTGISLAVYLERKTAGIL